MKDNVILGMREEWGRQVPVWLSCRDRSQHLYAIGKSGTGKTTLLRNLILQDIEAGRGVGIIDPHGDLAAEILNHIPRHRIEDVAYFDPSDFEYPVGFNLLAHVPPDRRHLAASGIVAAFKGIFPEFFGPRMEYIFYAAVIALLDCENVSMLGLQRMLSDDRYRAWVVRQVKDPVVRSFWSREFEAYDKKTKAEMVSPILNKVGQLMLSPQLRNILGQVRNRIDPRYMMDRGRIFIASLSKGKIGADKANLIGSLLVAQFEIAAMSRADLPDVARKKFFLYVDEFQSFVSEAFASMLSESRKYGLCLTLSNQYLGQLRPSIAEAVLGNVGSLAVFRVGHADAKSLEGTLGESYAASHVREFSNGEMCAKLLCDGRDIPPIICRSVLASPAPRNLKTAIIRRSRERYAQERSEVGRKIDSWLK